MIGPNPADLAAMKANPNVKVLTQPGLNIGYLAFNTMKPPFDKKDVRQALTMAIDKAAIIKDVYQGAGQAAKNLIPPTIWCYNDKVEDYPYDPDEGQGDAEGGRRRRSLDIDLWYMPVQRPYNPERQAHRRDDAGRSRQGRRQRQARHLRMGRIPQAPAGAASTDWASSAGPATMAIPTTSSSCSAATRRRIGGQNLAKWCNKDFDDLLKKARKIADTAERTKLYEKMQEIAHEEAPVFLIAHSVVFEPMRKNVTGYKVSPLGRHDFDGVDLQ